MGEHNTRLIDPNDIDGEAVPFGGEATVAAGEYILAEEEAINREVILTILEAAMFTLLAQNKMTLSHITGPDTAQLIMETGLRFGGTIGSAALWDTASPLVRPGHDVSSEWPEEMVRDYNEGILSTSHKGG